MKHEYCHYFSKNRIFEKKKIWKNFKKFWARDRTGDLSVMSSLTRPLHQKNLLEIWAKKNALSSVGNYCSKTKAAGISNAQIFKSLRSASNFIWQVGNPNSFDMCSGCSKVYVASFFLIFGEFFFKRRKIASPTHLPWSMKKVLRRYPFKILCGNWSLPYTGWEKPKKQIFPSAPTEISQFQNMASIKTNKIKKRTPLHNINFWKLTTLLFCPKRFRHSKGPKNAICLWLSLR